MTKSEFVDQVADRAGLSKKDAGDAVDAVLATIEDALKRGSDVVFSGFGKFSVAGIGALAVTLGVGTAVATGSGVASATTGSESDGSGTTTAQPVRPIMVQVLRPKHPRRPRRSRRNRRPSPGTTANTFHTEAVEAAGVMVQEVTKAVLSLPSSTERT